MTIDERRDLAKIHKQGMGYIYKITNPSGKIYIGKTTDILRRYNNHLSTKNKKQSLINNSINKYGLENHDFMIMDSVPFENLSNAEQFYIAICKSYRGENINGMNLTIGGDGTQGYKMSNATKSKIAKKAIGRVATKETKEKLSAINKNKIVSEETKHKMSESNRARWTNIEFREKMLRVHVGRKRSAETCKKISEKAKGRPTSDAAREKMSKSRKGVKFTDEHKAKIAEANRGRVPSKECRLKISKAQIARIAKKKLENAVNNAQ